MNTVSESFLNKLLNFFYLKPKNPVSLGKAFVVSFFLGLFGVDRLIMGYKFWWLKTITFGGMWVWYFIDLYNISIGKMKMADGRDLV